MNKFSLNTTLLFVLHGSMLFGMWPIQLETIDDIPKLCIDLTRSLLAQQLITGWHPDTSQLPPQKSMPLDDPTDGIICRVLNGHSKFKLHVQECLECPLQTCGRGPKMCLVFTPNTLHNETWHSEYEHLINKPEWFVKGISYDLFPYVEWGKKLGQAYQDYIEKLKKNWIHFSPIKNFDPDTQVAFLGNRKLDDDCEMQLIRALIEKCGLAKYAVCLRDEDTYRNEPTIFLIIQKGKLYEFNKFFKFRFTERSGTPFLVY